MLYYVIYAPHRCRQAKLEVHQLINGEYILQAGNPIWLPELGLGIGTERGTYQGINREWLYWYNQAGERLLTPEERVRQAEYRTRQAESEAQRLKAQLRALGIDPETLS